MEVTSGSNNVIGVPDGNPAPIKGNQVEATPGSTIQQKQPIVAKKKCKETERKPVV